MRGVSLEAYRVSVSSVPSSSSQGSGQDDCDIFGDVFMWGEGIGEGLLGGGTYRVGTGISAKVDALLPKVLTSAHILDVQQIACGRRHAALVNKHGDVFSWGEEFGGRLGHGVNSDSPYPQPVEALANNNVEFVACGEYHTCAVTFSGDLYTWGNGTHNFGLLGHDNDLSHWTPKKVNGPLAGVHVSSVSCGTWHTSLLTSSGQLFTFGDGTFGVLGHGDRKCVSYPREVESLKGLRTTGVSCGVWHTAAVVEVMAGITGSDNSSGKIFTWGDGDKGCLGHGDKDPRLVPTCVSALIDYNFRQVACGHSLTVALASSGQVFTTGSPVFGQLGSPQADGKLPICVEGNLWEAIVEEVACGAHHVAVLTSKAEVYTWGKGANGRLGHGDVEDRNCPTLVVALKDKQVKNIACGSSFTAAICLHKVHKWLLGTEQSWCVGCRQPFSFTRKRHNCYNCGFAFCHACSSRKAFKASMAPDLNKAYRVCDSCYAKLKMAETWGASHINMAKKRFNVEVKDKLEKSEGKLSVPLLALSMIPGVQLDGRGPPRRGKKIDSSTSRVAPAPVGLLPWVETNMSMVFDQPLADSSKILNDVLPSRKGSRSVSPFLRRQNLPRSTTPNPTIRGLAFPNTIADDMIKRNGVLSEEIFKLRREVKNLSLQNQKLGSELQLSEKRAQDFMAVAAKESAKCKAAKEVMKSLTAQLKDMAGRLPAGSYQNERLHMDAGHGLPLHGIDSLCSDALTQASNGMDLSVIPDAKPVAKSDADTSRMPKHTSISDVKNAHDVILNGMIPTEQGSNYRLVGEQVSRPLDNADVLDNSGGIGSRKTSGQAGPAISNHRREVDSEWVEQDEPGVYITLKALPDGGTDLKRMRFSRRKFTQRQAEIWWAENRHRVLKKHDIRSVENSASLTSLKTRMGEHGGTTNPHAAS